jgi:putative hemolysin
VFIEVAFLLLLICLNGLLAMSELAIVSARPARLKAQVDQGNRGTSIALNLAADPGRFLSTVQIGITLVGVLAGAFSGATIGLRLAVVLPDLGVPQGMADEVGVGLVVIATTYLSLIIGELVPKQIALAAPETVACRVAAAMYLLSRIAAPVVWFLDRSGKLVLWLLGQSGRRETSVSDEDIRMVLSEAAGAGIIHRVEKELIGGVMRFSDRRARGLMTPRHNVEIAEAGETRTEILGRFRTSGHSRLPLRQSDRDDIVGIIHSRDLLNSSFDDFDVKALTRPAPVIQENLPALEVIERLRNSPCHMLLVYDEYGHFEGIITPMDILGAIAGGFDETDADEPKFIEREGGSLLVAGWTPIDEFAERLNLVFKAKPSYETVAGLILERVGEVPAVGQSITIDGWRIEIIDMDGLRIDKLLVSRIPESN